MTDNEFITALDSLLLNVLSILSSIAAIVLLTTDHRVAGYGFWVFAAVLAIIDWRFSR